MKEDLQYLPNVEKYKLLESKDGDFSIFDSNSV